MDQGSAYQSEGVIPSRGLAGSLDKPVREGEVSRELNNLKSTSIEILQLTEELTKRLGSIISPKEEPINPSTGQQTDYLPSTPMATVLNGIYKEFTTSKKTLQFILKGLEL